MLSASQIRNGTAIIYQGEPFVVTNFQFVQPAKGGSFVRCKIKNLKNEKVIETTFKSSEGIEEADITKRNAQFLYKTGETLSFMDNETFEQHDILQDTIGESADFLKEGASVVLMMLDSIAFSAEIPKKVVMIVTDAPPVDKGDTKTSTQKLVTLENGKQINAPPFIKTGDQVVINTESGTYVERYKE
jgi:elongation factor P